MRFLIAIFVPPLGVLLCGKLFQFLLSLILWVVALVTLGAGIGFLLYVVASLHAVLVVNSHLAAKNADRIVKAIERGGRRR